MCSLSIRKNYSVVGQTNGRFGLINAFYGVDTSFEVNCQAVFTANLLSFMCL